MQLLDHNMWMSSCKSCKMGKKDFDEEKKLSFKNDSYLRITLKMIFGYLYEEYNYGYFRGN